MAARVPPQVPPRQQQQQQQQQEPNMSLIYHQTIIPTQKITHCVVGTFTLPGATDFVVVRHDTLELWTLHVERNTAECVHSTRLFANIYQIAAVPTVSAAGVHSTSGGILDSPSNGISSSSNNHNHNNHIGGGSAALQRLAVTSETGCLVLLRYDLDERPAPTRLMHDPTTTTVEDTDPSAASKLPSSSSSSSMVTSLRGKFVRVSEIALGRSGARLTVPGARLAVDPLGRAVFATALMRLKVLIPLRKHDDFQMKHNSLADFNSKGVLQDSVDDELLLSGGGSNNNNNNNNETDGGAAMKRRKVVRDVISFGSPVEAHRQTMIFSLCALDGATENPTFVTLEQELPEARSSTTTTEEQGNTSTSNTTTSTSTSTVAGGQAFLRVNPGTSQSSSHMGSTSSTNNNNNNNNSSSNQSKQLVVYAFVAGLRQVQRTHLVSVPATAHRLIAVPAAPFGPGGVLVCTDSEIIWYDLLPQLHGGGILGNSTAAGAGGGNSSSSGLLPPGVSPLSLFKTAAPFPRRDDFREHLYDPMIISHATTCVRSDFFMLLQDDQGDMFRVSLTLMDVQRSYDELRLVQQQQQQQFRGFGSLPTPPITVRSPLTVTYFDTIPPTTTMALFRRGFIFAASESSHTHGLYKIVKDGYRAEKDYILSRMRMVDQRHGSNRQEDYLVEDNKGISTTSDSAVPAIMEESGASKEAMPPPSVLSKGPSVLLPPPSTLQRTPKQQPHHSRVVPLFLPHKSLRHMMLLESYPNTPAITSFVASIPQQHDQGGEDNNNNNRQQQQQQQPHVQIDALVGRGSDSVLLHARYGYAARLESSFTLQAVFTFLTPLASLTGMQQRWREMQMDAAKNTSGSSNNTGHRSTGRKALRSSAGVWDDKLLLSTRQGTTVLSLTLTGQVEPDTLSGFITSEHTICAGSLRHGVGYVQITPSCISVLPYRPVAQLQQQQQQQNESVMPLPVAESVNWMHPHGKRILAAAISGNTMVVSFTQGGGIASFDMGMSGTRLQQLEAIPSFPHAPAISLLNDPNDEINTFGMASRTSSLSSSASSLAAIATVSQEVYIVNPKRLREPLETIRCTADSNNTNGTVGAAPAIVSVLLTYLGRTGGMRRLFCFIGHIDGTVTRCELDTATCKVMNKAVLTCGGSPCQMIAGDGERVCYVLCGEFNWRCDVRDGVPKTVPWRFPSPQAMYASFRRPPPSITTSASGTATDVEIPSGAQEELVLGVAGNTLSLFAAQQSGGVSTAETSLEYSFGHTPLSVAGRRLLQHPTRPEYLLVVGTEHRGYGVAALRRAASAAAAAAAEQHQQRHQGEDAASGAGEEGGNKKANSTTTSGGGGGIALDKPQRSLNHPNHYVSTLQLYNKRTDRLDPPVYFQEREAVLSAAVGSFVKDFGREPVVVVGCAENYTHGSGCGVGASWTQGRLRAFRFVVNHSNLPGAPGGSSPTLRLEQLHDTLITATDSSNSADGTSDRASALMDYPSALHICVEVGLLFVGMGAESGLHVYAWGQRRFLRKRRLPNVPSRITCIETVFITPPGAAAGGGGGGGASSVYASDLFRCGPNSTLARERRLLIVCGTIDQSLFIATVHPGSSSGSTSSGSTGAGGGSLSFLMIIARDSVPRSVTSIACLDERTFAVADRYGSVAFLRLPSNTRLGLAEPISQMSEAELAEAARYAATRQGLDEIALHHTGQLVTALRAHEYDPSAGADPALALRLLVYTTSLGAVGAYTPFVREEDAVLAAGLQPLIAAHIHSILHDGESGHPPFINAGRMTGANANAAHGPAHHVVEGDHAQMLLRASTSLFSTEAKTEVEAELARRERAEAAQRRVLGLPHRTWPALAELVAKQRALVTLPP